MIVISIVGLIICDVEILHSQETPESEKSTRSHEILFTPFLVKDLVLDIGGVGHTASLYRMRVPPPDKRNSPLTAGWVYAPGAGAPSRPNSIYYLLFSRKPPDEGFVTWWRYLPESDEEVNGSRYPIDVIAPAGETSVHIVLTLDHYTITFSHYEISVREAGLPIAEFKVKAKDGGLYQMSGPRPAFISGLFDPSGEETRGYVYKVSLIERNGRLEIEVFRKAQPGETEAPPVRAWYDAWKKVWRPILDPGDDRIIAISPTDHLENDPDILQAFEDAVRRSRERSAAEHEAEMARHEADVAEMNAAVAAEEARIAMQSGAARNAEGDTSKPLDGKTAPPPPVSEERSFPPDEGAVPLLPAAQHALSPAPESAEPARPSAAPRTPSPDPRRSTWLLVLASSVVPVALLLVWLLRSRKVPRRARG